MLAKEMLTIIASASINNVIGTKEKQLWKIRADLLRFKELTMGKTVIFGRKTYEEIGRPLLGRKIIILSKKVVPTLEYLWNRLPKNEEVFVAGGGQIYTLLLPYCQKMYITRVNKEFEGEIKFPKIGSEWELVERSEPVQDRKSGLEYWFEEWVKNPA